MAHLFTAGVRIMIAFREEPMMRRTMTALVIILGVAHGAAAQELAAKGEKLFTDQKCTLCHSVNGKGNVKGAMDGAGSKMTADEIRAWITAVSYTHLTLPTIYSV